MNSAATVEWWHRRRKAFRKETSFYWRYVLQNLSSGFLFFLLIAAFYLYTEWIESLPGDFPYYWITVPFLTWAAAHSPIRTFLQEADKVFILPTENKMSPYFSKAISYSFIRQAILVLIIFLLLWPLFSNLKNPSTPILLYFLFLLVMKWANLLGNWQESRALYDKYRLIARWLRFAVTGVTVFLMYQYGLLAAGSFGLTGVAGAWIGYKFLPRYYINWDYLIRMEKLHVQKHYLFFSWFVEVDKLPTRVRPRHWAARITSRFPFTQNNTYLYLLTKTYVRSETASISLRLTALSVFLMIVVPGDVGKLFCYAVPLWMSGVQLTSLQQYHRYLFWLKLYPVDSSQRTRSVISLTFTVLMGQAALTGLLLILLSENWLLTLGAVLASFLLIAVYTYPYLRKKLK